MDAVRLNKYISEAGVCSRREADRLIEAGEVTVDGEPAVLGMKVGEGQTVRVRGKVILPEEADIFLAFYKPRGLVCTTEERDGAENIYQFIGYPKRIFSMGRLDRDSEGLLILTNRGDAADAVMRGANRHEKEYLVETDREVMDDFLKEMRSGVFLEELGVTTRPCEAEKTGKHSFSVILTQGLNRQIRRMCETLGYRVISLKRVRVMNITIKGLAPGEYRRLTEEEVRQLYRDAGLEEKYLKKDIRPEEER